MHFQYKFNVLLIALVCLFLFSACQSKSRKGEIPQMIGTIKLSPAGGVRNTAVNSKTGYVYTMYGVSIEIFQKDKWLTTLSAGGQPQHIVVDETNNLIYTANRFTNSITIIQDTHIITTISLQVEEPSDIALDPNTGLVYITSPYVRKDGIRDVEGVVTVIKGPEIIDELHFGRIAFTQVEIDPHEGYVYLGDIGGILIVLKDLQEIARYEYPGIRGMDIHEQTGNLYVDTLNHITQFYQGKPVKQVTRKALRERGSYFEGFKVHPVTGDIYIMDRGHNKVIVVRDMQVIGRVPVGRNPVKIAIDPLTENVYVTALDSNNVTAIQGTKVLTTYKVGWYPYGIGVNPANGWVYVSNTNAGSVTILGFPDE